EALMVAAQQGDPRAIMALIEMLPDDEQKRVFKKYFTPEEPQMSPEEAAMAGMGQPDPMAELFSGGGTDITPVLSRLSAGGSPAGGVQAVARVERDTGGHLPVQLGPPLPVGPRLLPKAGVDQPPQAKRCTVESQPPDQHDDADDARHEELHAPNLH